MGQSFARLTITGLQGSEKIENLLHFVSADTASDDPTAAELLALAVKWDTDQVSSWKTFFPTDVTFVNIRAAGWKADGSVASALPVDHPLANAGTLTPTTRDGNSQVAIFHPGLGALVTINGAPGPINKAYFALGPLVSAAIDDTGFLIGIASPPFTTMATVLAAGVTVAGGAHWAPIKVSHSDAHVHKPSLHGWRAVSAGTWRMRASYRRSRNNNR